MNNASITHILTTLSKRFHIRGVGYFLLFAVFAGAMTGWAAPDAAPAMKPGDSSFKSDFLKADKLPQGWTAHGDVSMDAQSFKPGGHSIVLKRTLEKAGDPTDATSPTFPITAGTWDINLACKSDLDSHDNSFQSHITLEFLDASGKTLDQATLGEIFGTKPWQLVTKRIETPKGAVSARFHVELQKTWGEFHLDALTAVFVAAATQKDDRIDRMYFASADPSQGHFLFPDEPKVFTVTVEATEALPPEQLIVTCTLTDYWGAEQFSPQKVKLTLLPDKKNNRLAYSGKLNLGKLALEVGKYYEIQGEIQRSKSDFYRNHSSFVIEPEAIANSYKPLEIPFSGRNWDGRIPEGFTMSHRLGIRIMNLWSGFEPVPPYANHAPCIDLVKKFHMGGIFGVPSGTIEGHGENWDKYDDKALREGVRKLITDYRSSADPFIISLGNEPPVIAERIPANVKAYQSIYEEAKKTDPSVIVIGTSIGLAEPFFQGGFGKWCDVYDFHVYEDSENVAKALQAYPEMFKKYGNAKPIWSTEIGINSQGLTRHTVAVDMVKKFTLFFANGGENMSWFDLFYPDGDAKIVGSSGEAHDTFDSRYCQYAPKLTAVKYYDLINSIAIKKFVEQKQYGDDVRGFLFRDKENRQLQVLWKNKGRQDAFLPLAGVKNVQVIKIDGTHRELNADGKGVTLTIDEDPLLLLYAGTTPLADKLEAPAASVTVPAGIVRGTPTDLTVNLSGATAKQVSLIAPPAWKVSKAVAGQSVKFTLTSPEVTTIREADLIVTIGDGKSKNTGELYLRPAVTGQLSAHIMPVPATDGNQGSVKLIVKNNGTASQAVTWNLGLAFQKALVDGKYDETPAPVTDAHFAQASTGQATIAGGATQEFVVPLAGVDSQTAYGVHATVTDATGRSVARDRNVAGFVPVPKAKGKIAFDGTLSAPDWKSAPVEKIVEKRQYFTFDPKLATWKGPQDLSADVRFLWDDNYLYVGVEVTDDLPGILQEDGNLWQGDGLQFLIDPCRAMDESVGKYDYACALGKKGPQAWCYLSADAKAPSGEAKDIIVSAKRKDPKTGSTTYIIAFPWVRVAPFQPAVGGDIGLTIILNEDDGQGRHSFMTWFGNAHSKQVDTVGDLILTQ